MLEGKLSTGNQSYPGTAQLQEPGWGFVGERHRLDHGPEKGQAFLLTEAAFHVATSSLTLIQTFLQGGVLHPRPQEVGSKRKLCSSFGLGAWEGAQSLANGTVDGATVLLGRVSKAAGDIRGRSC